MDLIGIVAEQLFATLRGGTDKVSVTDFIHCFVYVLLPLTGFTEERGWIGVLERGHY